MVDRPLSPDELAELDRAIGPRIGFGDMQRELVTPAGLGGRVEWWQRTYPRGVVDFVSGFQHIALLDVRPADVMQTIDESSHALGNVRRSENHPAIRDANPPWAMEYLFHDHLERLGRPPTWDEFRVAVILIRPRVWYDPVMSAGVGSGLDDRAIHRAMQWRLGNAWQALMRQTYLFAALRQTHGIPVKYHMLAHVLLRVDLWMERKIVQMWMPNPHELRKDDPRRIFGDRGFAIYANEIARQGYGDVWLPTDAAIEEIADFLTEE